MKARILYISYDGLLEPLGQSQVLQYLKELARDNEVTLLSYEKKEDWQDAPRRSALAREVREAGVRWRPLRYHKRPSALATAYDLQVGILVSALLVLRHRIRIVHARSYVPSVLALYLQRVFGVRFIFDMRGFWADERVDGGLWRPDSRIYRVAKWFERRFLTSADVVVSLTNAGASAIRDFPYLRHRAPPLEVIPTCVNLGLFRPAEDARAGNGERPFTLGYVGSAGTWYLFDEVLECFQLLREQRPGARLRVVNRNDHRYIRERMKAHGVPDDQVEILSADFSRVGSEMSGMDAGIFFYKPTFSRKATAPTRLGEFLACGVPCLGNAGVGDVQQILEGERVGVVLEDFGREAMQDAIRQLLALAADPEVRSRCTRVADRYFSLERGVEAYRRIYRTLSAAPS